MNNKTIIDNISLCDIKISEIHGYGAFATEDIAKGTTLCKLDGQYMEWKLYDKIISIVDEKIKDLKDYFFMEWNAISDETLLVRAVRTKYSFINHSRKPNLRIEKEGMILFTIKDIYCGEELLLDYREEPLREEYINGHGKTYL